LLQYLLENYGLRLQASRRLANLTYCFAMVWNFYFNFFSLIKKIFFQVSLIFCFNNFASNFSIYCASATIKRWTCRGNK